MSNDLNLICICLDTFRTDLLDGKLDFVETPNLDRLAEKSVRFRNCFGECQPTLQMRRSVFTGERGFPWNYNFDRRGHWHHAAGWHKIPPHQDTLAEILLRRGYLTGMVADTYHMFKPTMNYTRGFANYEFVRGQETDNWKGGTPEMIEERIKGLVREPVNWDRHTGLTQYLYNTEFRQGEEDYSAARVFSAASDWLDLNAANAPFFLWVDSFDPHEPWDPPSGYAEKYCSDYGGKDFVFPGAAWEKGEPSEEEIERIKALYYGEVTFVDRWVGQLLDKIDQLDLWEETIVMVLSDHGTQVMDHGKFGKTPENLRAYNTKILWDVYHPQLEEPSSVGSLTQAHDVFPTALGLLDVPATSAGRDAWPLVEGEREKIRDHVVTGWAGWSEGKATGYASVRDPDWNYIAPVGQEESAEGVEAERLYDLEADPNEERDVISAHPEVAASMRERLEAVIESPLPGSFNEVCDPAPFPLQRFHEYRKRAES